MVPTIMILIDMQYSEKSKPVALSIIELRKSEVSGRRAVSQSVSRKFC